MKKLVLLIVIFLIAVIYSIMWFVLANDFEENLAKEIKRLPAGGSVAESNTQNSGISVSGFPLDFNVYIAAGTYTIKADGDGKEADISDEADGAEGTDEISISFDTPIMYYIKVFEQKVRVILPKTIAVKYNIANKKEDLLLSFKGDFAELSLYFNSIMIYHFKDLVMDDNLSLEKISDSNFLKDLKKVTYIDGGLNLYKGIKPKMLYSHDKFVTSVLKKELSENYGSYSILLEYTNSLLRNEYYR